MDYSALSSGFADDDDESPFARERSTGLPKPSSSPPSASSPFLRPRSHLGSPGSSGGFADHDQHGVPFLGYSPDLGLGASSSSSHPAVESEDGGFGAARTKLNPEDGDDDDDGDDEHPGHGRTTESNGSTGDREPTRQPHQTHQTPARYKPHLQQQQQQQQQQQHQQHQHQQQQQQRPNQFLQAKVTGLERNGRKDPILKFEVHVCHHYHHLYGG